MVAATMTFQSVISPPGGVWQGDTTHDGLACTQYGFCEAGTAVLGYAWPPAFLKFIFFNSCSFFSSLCHVASYEWLFSRDQTRKNSQSGLSFGWNMGYVASARWLHSNNPNTVLGRLMAQVLIKCSIHPTNSIASLNVYNTKYFCILVLMLQINWKSKS
ncbi:hypothetical protein VNO78_17501 [Psophocarpus tetragonolobus]|uniref:PGG domain-containing protein n=1 Tax=Psophocarpus tetragonolobus TaxID=3891 RepID=A0AAN9SGX2_PSOTE